VNQEQILDLFKRSGALLEGHFQLTSGLHSPQYFQCAKVLQYPEYATAICAEIANHFAVKPIDIVIAPAIGGIVVAQETGRLLAANKKNLRILFTERKEGTMQLRRGFSIERGAHVLVCEDVITTGGSVSEVIGIVRSFGGNISGVASIVDRSGGKINFDGKFFAAATLHVITYPPDSCPLCAKQIPIDKPGSRASA
jgi:orotate phosphoribosyltransferase